MVLGAPGRAFRQGYGTKEINNEVAVQRCPQSIFSGPAGDLAGGRPWPLSCAAAARAATGREWLAWSPLSSIGGRKRLSPNVTF